MKKTGLKKRTYRRKGRRSARRVPRRIKKSPNHEIFSVLQKKLVTLVHEQTQGGSNDFYAHSLSFRLSDIDNYQRFTTLYDKYRIKSISIRIHPAFNVNQADTTPAKGSSAGVWMITYDYDDSVLFTTPQQALTREKVISKSNTRPVKYRIQPRVLMLSGNSASPATTQTAVQKRSPWLDTASADVVHYGIKLACQYNSTFPLPPQSGVADAKYIMIATYKLEFCDVVNMNSSTVIDYDKGQGSNMYDYEDVINAPQVS